ncbi:hypothetical protein EJB05_28792, partial [Eragrostis curvula]
IRGLAFWMEDVVDEFKYKLEDAKHGGFAAKMKKRIHHVKWRLERSGGGSDHFAGSEVSCFAREEDLVGIQDNAEKLKGWLLDNLDEKKGKIITVWGMGGAGKTTLVDHDYKIVKNGFDVAAWVTVSRSWQVEDLLKKIAGGFGIPGNLLFFKHPTPSEWSKVYDDLELQSMKHVIPGVEMILRVSLEDLPRRLIRHWIIAGFIKEKANKTLEEVAEGYMNDLVNRSLLQVVERNEFGRVKSCRMHDVVRSLAVEKAENEGFGKINEGSTTFCMDVTRRLSIQSTNIAPLNQSGVRHLRAIHVFLSSIDIDLLRPMLASSNFLSTLDLQGTQIKILPDAVFSLFNLRFLGLRDSGIEVLPEAVRRLVNLEVLDAAYTGLLSLPQGVAKLNKLRYLFATQPGCAGQLWSGVEVPRGIKNLTGLHALQNVKASLETLCDIAALWELRTLAVCNLKSEHSLNLCSAIMNLSHLVHLSISAANENEVLPWEALRLPANISKLDLDGKLEKIHMHRILSPWSHLTSLTQLSLGCSNFDEDSFSSLMVLQLKCLPRRIENLAALEGLLLQDTAEELIEKLRKNHEADECHKELMAIGHIRNVVISEHVSNK